MLHRTFLAENWCFDFYTVSEHINEEQVQGYIGHYLQNILYYSTREEKMKREERLGK